jgi:hypothetical protein
VTARHGHQRIASTGSRTRTRRQFLLRGGLLGAAVVVAGTSLRLPPAGAIESLFPGHARKALQRLARDTISGLVVFAVPGSDVYSRAQGVTSPTPGALDARAEQLVLDALDNFLPFPAQLTRPLAAALATGTSDTLLPAAMSPLTSGLEEAAARFDDALGIVLANDEAVPLSALVSLLLNFVATSVDPLAILGPFPASPFANLRATQKAEVFRRLEGDHAELIELLDSAAPEPGKETLSGFVKFLAGTLLEFAAFTPFTEVGVFDRERRVATERPVGWELTRYLPGRRTPVDGRDEFKGYYRGRRSVG